MGTKEILKKLVKNSAKKVVDKVGGSDFTDYASSKIAKKMVPDSQKKYVSDETSGKKALGSAGNIGLTIAALAGLGKTGRVSKPTSEITPEQHWNKVNSKPIEDPFKKTPMSKRQSRRSLKEIIKENEKGLPSNWGV